MQSSAEFFFESPRKVGFVSSETVASTHAEPSDSEPGPVSGQGLRPRTLQQIEVSSAGDPQNHGFQLWSNFS